MPYSIQHTVGAALSLNISAVTLNSQDLGGSLSEHLKHLGLQPDRITVEVTESALMPRGGRETTVLHDLRASGFHLSVDDLGTGFSSLSYLGSLPIQEVKIDRSFVAELSHPDRRRSAAIIRSILAIGEALELDVVAEGVETEAQLTWLCAQGCQAAQGFLLSRPPSVQEFEARLRDESGLERRCSLPRAVRRRTSNPASGPLRMDEPLVSP